MEQVRVQSKVIAFAMTMVMALAITLAFAPAAFAVDWNSNVTVTAMGGNNGQIATYDTETGNITYTQGTGKTETGQYVDVTMQFTSARDLSNLSASDAESYLQANTTIAGRSLNGSQYNRDIYDVVVDDDNDKITFKIAFNRAWNTATAAFYTTANYNGKLNIAANSNSSSIIYDAMGGNAVETLIGTGVAISDNSGTLSNGDKTKTFTISSAAYNRGMVHVLIKNGDEAVFSGTGTFTNGGLTVHAHTFIEQTTTDFASSIATAAQDIVDEAAEPDDPAAEPVVIPYSFEAGSDGAFSVTTTESGATATNITAYIYDCNYLNSIHGSVGDITEPEMQNS